MEASFNQPWGLEPEGVPGDLYPAPGVKRVSTPGTGKGGRSDSSFLEQFSFIGLADFWPGQFSSS